MLYELADDRSLPVEARGETTGLSYRLRARHRLVEPESPVDRASDEEIVALLRACRSCRDRLIVRSKITKKDGVAGQQTDQLCVESVHAVLAAP